MSISHFFQRWWRNKDESEKIVSMVGMCNEGRHALYVIWWVWRRSRNSHYGLIAPGISVCVSTREELMILPTNREGEGGDVRPLWSARWPEPSQGLLSHEDVAPTPGTDNKETSLSSDRRTWRKDEEGRREDTFFTAGGIFVLPSWRGIA